MWEAMTSGSGGAISQCSPFSAAIPVAASGVSTTGRVGTGQVLLRPGDRLVLYTDGVTDAVDAGGQLFSEARLREALEGARGPRSQDVIQHVLDQVQRFSAGAPQADDITLVVLTYAGPGEEPRSAGG